MRPYPRLMRTIFEINRYLHTSASVELYFLPYIIENIMQIIEAMNGNRFDHQLLFKICASPL
jgi:Ni,Fe-hydrogenase III large subunit